MKKLLSLILCLYSFTNIKSQEITIIERRYKYSDDITLNVPQYGIKLTVPKGVSFDHSCFGYEKTELKEKKNEIYYSFDPYDCHNEYDPSCFKFTLHKEKNPSLRLYIAPFNEKVASYLKGNKRSLINDDSGLEIIPSITSEIGESVGVKGEFGNDEHAEMHIFNIFPYSFIFVYSPDTSVEGRDVNSEIIKSFSKIKIKKGKTKD